MVLHTAEMRAHCHSINEQVAKFSVSLTSFSAVEGILTYGRWDKFDPAMMSGLSSIAKKVLPDCIFKAVPCKLIYKTERNCGLFQIEQTMDGQKRLPIQIAAKSCGPLATHLAKLLLWLASAGAEKAQLQAAKSMLQS